MFHLISKESRVAAGMLAALLAVAGCVPEASGESGGAASAAVASATLATAAAETPTIKVYKSPTCGCCALWVDYMREAGFKLDVEDTDNMVGIKVDGGVPLQLQSCHTAFVGDYVFEGHVPAEVIARFLAEAPNARGLAVPGMPIGSPGMEFGDRVDPYDVIQFGGQGGTSVYESRPEQP